MPQSEHHAADTMVPLAIPLHPEFLRWCGYTGDARYVAFYWVGNKCYVNDGQIAHVGEGWIFLTYVQHWRVYPLLRQYHLGSEEGLARHWLIVDQEQRTVHVAEMPLARHVLQSQWPSQSEELSQQVVDRVERLHHLVVNVSGLLPPPTTQQLTSALMAEQRYAQALFVWLEKGDFQ